MPPSESDQQRNARNFPEPSMSRGITDPDKIKLFDGLSDARYNPTTLANSIHNIQLAICSADKSEQKVLLGNCARSLGLAYVAATTRHDLLNEFPVAETYGKAVALGWPIIHVRISKNRPVERTRDERNVLAGTKDEFFITSYEGANTRNNVIVQVSPYETTEEGAEERAIRVLFSHLNSLIFSYSHFLKQNLDGSLRASREAIKDHIRNIIKRFERFSPEAPAAKNDEDFALAVKAFGAAYSGRVEELVERLEGLAEDLNKPRAFENVITYLKSLFDLVVTTAVKAAVETTVKTGKG